MIIFCETAAEFEVAVGAVNKGILVNAVTGEWYDGDRHTTDLPVYHREVVEAALKKVAE